MNATRPDADEITPAPPADVSRREVAVRFGTGRAGVLGGTEGWALPGGQQEGGQSSGPETDHDLAARDIGVWAGGVRDVHSAPPCG